MKLRNSVNGNKPFEGDRTFRWQAIPANAKILSAIATVTPVDSKLGSPFTELLTFRDGTGDFGATQAGGTALNLPWVEVDFHSRRTLAGMTGSFGTIAGNAGGCELQVDVGGGTYVEINQNGAFRTPSDPPNSFFRVEGSAADLPGLTVAKLKATSRTATRPILSTLRLRSVPTQVSLRVGELPPFWTHVGEMTLAETTPDFTTVLQAALTTAKIENGFYDLPITVHSDSIARLKIELEVEVLAQQEVFTKAVPEVVLPFDVSTLAKSKTAELSIEVPANSRVVPGQTSARVRGAFTETRIAAGPTGVDKPTAAVEVSRTYSQAQIIALDREVAAVAVDLLLESLTPSVSLQMDIRGDFDGKPDEIPLLPAPVELSIEQQPQKGGAWTSVPLPAEFLFAKGKEKSTAEGETASPEKLTRYWLLIQCLEGRAAWSVVEAPAFEKSKTTNAQSTRDGGLTWQDTALIPGTLQEKKPTPPYIAFFRLRDKPKTFKMPIKLQIGSGNNAVEKTLERFEPLGRVDFTIDTELAEGINKYLDSSVAALPETQHLLNADFEKWSRVGQEPIPQPVINLRASADAVAFSPDGALAYLLDQPPGKDPFLLIIDVACNEEIKEKAIPLAPFLLPNSLVISPDGTRAYASTGRNLRVVDLKANHVIGEPFNLELDPNEGLANDLALSPDGRSLYVANLRTITTKFNHIRVIDTAKLEQQLTTGVVQTDVKVLHVLPVPFLPPASLQSQAPRALAVSPDGASLYLVIDLGTSSGGLVMRVNTNTFAIEGEITVGIGPSAIALTPNGKLAVVTNTISNDVSIINTATGAVVRVSVDPSPIDVAISSDGMRAYVLRNQGDTTISVIDLDRRIVLPGAFAATSGASLQIPRRALALAPGEDVIYVLLNDTSDMLSVWLGARVPAEWQRTTGEVRPRCLPTPFHLVPELGSASLPTSLSQVVPVAESTPYEFSFWGIAFEPDTDEPPAIAEVLWLNDACGLLQADSIPIEVKPIQQEGDQFPTNASFAVSPGGLKTPLSFHRLSTRELNGEIQPLTSPVGAAQAEVRFSVGMTAVARVDLVSLAASSELTANGDFKLQEKDQLVGWTLTPELTPGFGARRLEDGVELANAGSATVELRQVVAAESNQPFTLEFQGKATAATLDTPGIELRWLDANGAPAGEPTFLQVLPNGLDSAIASGTVPKDSSKVEIRVAVPPKTTLEVKRVSLRYAKTTSVPIKFIAEAPGEMTVSEVRVGFEEIERKRPELPTGGRLCKTTPPGSEPGERGDSCFCHHCEEETEMRDMQPVMTEAGQPATKGRCSNCRTELLSIGGPSLANAEALPLRQTMRPRPVIVSAAGLVHMSEPAQVAREAAPLLTDIHGIGEARANQLRTIGIDSVEKLAASTVETVTKIKFITPKMASQIIAQAKSLTNS